MPNGHIRDFDPEDGPAWENGNAAIARRNLIWSTVSTHIAFSVWSLWSVLVLFMPESVYGIRQADKLLLAAVATLVGACVRMPYVWATAKFGGRDWAMFSSLILLLPTIGTLLLLENPGQPLWMYVLCAALTGLGGGNYAASLANVDAFYPQRLKGVALGLCGGIGNLGVAAVQLVGLLVLATVGNTRPELVCALYLVLLAVAGVGAALRMDNLEHSLDEVGSIRSILSFADSWIVSALYCAAFGSFIGFAFAFAQVLHATFEKAGHSPAEAALYAARIAFLGPLLGALARIYGGRVADRRGGGRVTFAAFLGMTLAAAALVVTSTIDDHSSVATTSTVAIYIAGFMVLFFLSGVGNGSVLKMIPSIFDAASRSLQAGESERRHWARSHSGALIGFATAVGALGGVGINLTLRQAYTSTGSETPAFWVFLMAYVAVAVLTWFRYVHRPSRVPIRVGDRVRAAPEKVSA